MDWKRAKSRIDMSYWPVPAGVLAGAALLLAADIAVRLILPERDLKLGVLTALVGAPLFLHLIWKTRSGGRV